MLNKAQIIGRLGKDPEVRYTNSGEVIASFTVATSERYKDRNGERQEKTEWHNVTAFRKLAEIIGQHLRKGALVYVEGKIETRKWQTDAGETRYSTSIIASEMKMLGGKSEQSAQQPQSAPQSAPQNEANQFDDDIPF